MYFRSSNYNDCIRMLEFSIEPYLSFYFPIFSFICQARHQFDFNTINLIFFIRCFCALNPISDSSCHTFDLHKVRQFSAKNVRIFRMKTTNLPLPTKNRYKSFISFVQRKRIAYHLYNFAYL